MYRLKTYKPVAVAEHDALGEPFMGGAGVLVTWEPTWEPKSTFEKLFPTVGAELIANYLREKERAAVAAATMAAAWPPPDVSTEERLAQQGLVAPPRPAWQLTRPDALSNITLDTMPVHPELDVEAPVGTDAPFVRIEHPAPHATRSLAHIHDRTGRWLGTMTCERLAHLRDRFTAARAGRAHVFQELQAGTFEEELVGTAPSERTH